MTVAYKHLDTKLRVAQLTIGQWVSVVAGIGLGMFWGTSLSPFGTYVTFMSSVYLGALPVGAAFLASVSEFDLALIVRSLVAWRRRDGRYVPGAGQSARGYVLREKPDARAEGRKDQAPELDLASLWEDS
jgi:hypothetical protein